ncbi:beclin-1-like protein [Aethina tumida]|uniref:beclin-1-like protein n=1 Tax=Aethina tumida TaxID=116153 RepID=UPI00096B5ACC|nr:beclin-1-like protein [Aethina tumida]
MADDKILTFSFTCQKCFQPLKLDESLNSFSEHISAELNIPIHSNPDVDLESQATSFDHYVPPYRLTDSGNGVNGFMLISDENESEGFTGRLKVHEALFDTLSGNSNIDHPLCDECTDCLTEMLEKQLKITESEYEDYLQYYRSLQQIDLNEPKLSELQKELNDLKDEQKRYLEEMEAFEKEEEEILNEIEKQEEVSRKILIEENKYYQEYTKHRRTLASTEEDARSLDVQLNLANSHFVKLKNTNVFNATFHIWHKEHFGTINGFCLGRLPSAPVDWSEINAAWGQTALLLSALARKINLKFERYRLVPYGNHSYIEVIGEQKELPLYGSGGFKFLWDTKFDHGMVAFLDCLSQFQEKVEQMEKPTKMFCFPYRTNSKGKIEDKEASYSIKIQLNSEEQWTKALKFMLTNLKWGLAWLASQFSNDGDESIPCEN